MIVILIVVVFLTKSHYIFSVMHSWARGERSAAQQARRVVAMIVIIDLILCIAL